MLQESYMIWHPRIYSQADNTVVIVFNLTPFILDQLPRNLSKQTYQQFIRDLNIEAPVISGNVRSYWTNYHRELLDTGNWRDEWHQNWLISIQVDRKIEPLNLDSEDIVTSATPISIDDYSNAENEQGELLDCMIIADFKDRGARAEAARMLQSYFDGLEQHVAGEYHYSIELIEIGNLYWQLQILFGRLKPSFFANGADFAHMLETVCQSQGAITFFDERVNEWGEL